MDFKNFGNFLFFIVSFIVFLHVFMWYYSFDPTPSFKKMLQENIQIQLPH